MGTLRFLGPALLVVGVGCLAAGFALEGATLNLVLIFPVITATGPWSFLGILLIVAGFFTTFLFRPARVDLAVPRPPEPPMAGAPPASSLRPSAERRWGGVVFLGPFPIVFGSDQRVTLLMLVIGVVLFIALVALVLIR